MDHSNPGNIKFLPIITVGQSTKQREMVTAEVRAHTARMTHARRKQRQQDQEQREHRAPALSCVNDINDDAQETGSYAVTLHGSSDPFSSFPIPITPEINQIVKTTRDVVLPALYIPSFIRRLSFGVSKDISYDRVQFALGGTTVVADINRFKHANEGIALAWLSSSIPYLVRLGYSQQNHDLSMMALRMRTRSLRLLREKLSQDPARDQDTLYATIIHIMLHFRGDCKQGNSETASVHGNTFLRLLASVTDDVTVLQLLIIFMFNMTELAVNNLERPVVTLSSDLIKRLTDFWAMASNQLQRLVLDPGDLHPGVRHPAVRTVFRTLQYCLAIGETPLPITDAAEKARGDLVYSWLGSQTFCDMTVLVNLYLDLTEEDRGQTTSGVRSCDLCIILCLLHVLRKSIHEADLDGRDLRDASYVIMPRLRKHSEDALNLLTLEEVLENDEVLFWIFYVGAQHEQQNGAKANPTTAHRERQSSLWFTSMLVRQARRLKIESWPAARTVLDRFVYNRHMKPAGDLWFEQCLEGEGWEPPLGGGLSR